MGTVSRQISIAGNATYTPSDGARALIRSAILTTDVTVATRRLQVGGNDVSSKTATANLTDTDLLDREVSVGAGVVVSIFGGAAGDILNMTVDEIVESYG